MSKFIDKCKCSVNKALDNTFFQNIANIILLVVVAILIISLMLSPAIDVYKRQGSKRGGNGVIIA